MGGKESVMTKYELFGNKKNLRGQGQDGKLIISESQEREFTELGIINNGCLISEDGKKMRYMVGDNEAQVFQFHIPRDQWGKTYNLVSYPHPDGGRIKVIFVPSKSRFEIWENLKGEKRTMVMRVDGLDKVNSIVNKWNELYEDIVSISVDDLEEAVR